MENVALGLQNFLICIEMLIAAVAHYFVFSHKPFIDPAAAQVSLPLTALLVHTAYGPLDLVVQSAGLTWCVESLFPVSLRCLVLLHAFECWM